MLTLKDIKKNIVKTNNVETITFGDIYKNWNVKEIKYPSININLESSTIVNGSVTYKFIITYADNLIEDKRNELQIYDEATTTLYNYIDMFSEDVVIDSKTFTYFNENFADCVAGAFSEIEITLPFTKKCL